MYTAFISCVSIQFEIYTEGERLFALPETDFPELVYVRKELNILQKLYSLYNAVMDTVEGWLDTLFVKINIDRIAEQLDDFVKKSRCVGGGVGVRVWIGVWGYVGVVY